MSLKYLTLFIVFLFGNGVLAQHSILDRFFVSEINGEVHIECVIGYGNTCTGIDFLRSKDSINFEIVGQIAGVCGSISSPITYNFIDKKPIKDKTSYYKLRLGLSGYSYILPIQVVDVEDVGYQIRSNPADIHAVIYFKNRPNEEHSITLFNHLGVPVFSQSTYTNFFDLDLTNVPSGIYIFSISSSTIKGRIQVQH